MGAVAPTQKGGLDMGCNCGSKNRRPEPPREAAGPPPTPGRVLGTPTPAAPAAPAAQGGDSDG